MNNVKSSHDDGKPYRASEPVIPKRSQAKSSKAAEAYLQKSSRRFRVHSDSR